ATTLAAQRVDLIQEDDAWGIFLGMLEKVAHPGRPDSDEHLDEIRAAQREVRNLGLAGDRAREQRFAGARWADQQDPPRHAGPQLSETAGRLQEFDDLLQLVL